jgi:dTDP-4-dehydrorhamnose reductase
MKILITGSNGLLGQKLVYLLQKYPEHQFLATARGVNRVTQAGSFQYQSVDITNRDEVMKIAESYRPDAVIHTAAMTQVDDCEDQRELCWNLNVDAVANWIEACKSVNAHLVHVSTDFIFDGLHGPYTEEAVAAPLSYYGESKLEAEKLVLDSGISASIIRTVLVYGIAEDMSRSNIVLWAKGALEKQQPIKVVDDQFRTPTLAEDLAMGCYLAAVQKANGVYNISGKDFMSIRELVARVARYFKLDDSLVQTVSSSTLNQKAKRPPRTGFILDKARRELGFEPHSFEEGIALVMSQFRK